MVCRTSRDYFRYDPRMGVIENQKRQDALLRRLGELAKHRSDSDVFPYDLDQSIRVVLFTRDGPRFAVHGVHTESSHELTYDLNTLMDAKLIRVFVVEEENGFIRLNPEGLTRIAELER